MKKILPVILLLGVSANTLAKTTDARVAVKATVTGATCNVTTSPNEINFNTMTAADIGNDRVTAKEVALELDCDWMAKNVKVTFNPALGFLTGNNRVMKSGRTGLGFKLQFASSNPGTLTDTPFGEEQTWATMTSAASPYSLGGIISLKPFHINNEEIQVGDVNTNLSIDVQYD